MLLSHPPEKYQSVVCNSVLHDEEISAAFSQTINHHKRSITTIDTRFIDRFIH